MNEQDFAQRVTRRLLPDRRSLEDRLYDFFQRTSPEAPARRRVEALLELARERRDAAQGVNNC